MDRKRVAGLIAVALVAASISLTTASAAGVFITEFNSSTGVGSQNFEFVEFTNTSASPVNMTGWSEDDSNRTPNKSGHSLSAFGMLQPGESAIFTEAMPDAFRTYWWGGVAAAPAGLKIIGPYSNDNLSSSGDEVNLYDNLAALADRLTYPNGVPGGTASGVSRNPSSPSVLGLNQNVNWVNSSVGDSFGSFAAAGNTNLIGNPGKYVVVPEPASIVLMMLGMVGAGMARRRR